jgi:hypothetical protein
MNLLHISFHPVDKEALYSVLTAHHKTNCQPHAPDHHNLQQALVCNACSGYLNDTEDEDNTEDPNKLEPCKDNTTPQKNVPLTIHIHQWQNKPNWGITNVTLDGLISLKVQRIYTNCMSTPTRLFHHK